MPALLMDRLARNVRRPWLSRNEKTLPHFRGMDRLFQAIIAAGDAHHFVRGTRVRERAYTPVPVAQAKPARVEELQAGHRRGKGHFDGGRAAVNGIGRSSGAIRAIPVLQDHALDSPSGRRGGIGPGQSRPARSPRRRSIDARRLTAAPGWFCAGAN